MKALYDVYFKILLKFYSPISFMKLLYIEEFSIMKFEIDEIKIKKEASSSLWG
jgi:hypothetical protein